MILGRSTPQWIGLITAVAGFLQVVLPFALPGLDPMVLSIILGSTTTVLGVFIAFLANTSTTPIDDPKLKQGTMVRITDDAGTVVGHEPVPTPPPTPPADPTMPVTPPGG